MNQNSNSQQSSQSEQSYYPPTPEILGAEIDRDRYYRQEQKQRKKWKKILKNSILRFIFRVTSAFIQSFVIDSKTLRGQKFVTPEADKESRLLATTGSITNLIGTIGVTPIIIFTMTSLGYLSLPRIS